MDIIITAVGEFIWTASCAVVDFFLSSGVSVIAVFVSFLCAILASAFYKYTISREEMPTDEATSTHVDQNNDDLNEPSTITLITESSLTTLLPVTIDDEPNNNNNIIESLAEIEICVEENTNGNNETETESENEHEHEETPNNMLIETIEGTEEEIQKQQIANIYRLLNDQNLINNWTTTDFVEQLQMYGLEAYDEEELVESS